MKIHFVLVAGFSSDQREVLGLKNVLEKQGFSAEAISFYGEGLLDDFTDIQAHQCVENVTRFVNAAIEKHDAVYSIGLSLGGALLLEYAKKNHCLSGITSISTPFRLKRRKWISLGQKAYPVIYPFWKRLQKYKQLRLSPIGAANTVVEFLEGEFLNNLSHIKTPILLLHSKNDPIADHEALPEFCRSFSSLKRQLIYLDDGGHVIDRNSDLVAGHTLDFLRNLEP